MCKFKCYKYKIFKLIFQFPFSFFIFSHTLSFFIFSPISIFIFSQLAEATCSDRVQCRFESDRAYHAPVVQPGRGSRLKSGTAWVRIQPGAPHAPVADGEASGFQTRHWVFESPPGCQAPQQQVVSGRAANSVCAVQIRGGAPSSSHGGVDELLKSPVPKTGVSPANTTEG